MSDLVFGVERDSNRANSINGYNHYTGDPAYLPKDIARYTQATTEQVSAAARKWLSLERRIVAIVNPKKGAPICGVLASTSGRAR